MSYSRYWFFMLSFLQHILIHLQGRWYGVWDLHQNNPRSACVCVCVCMCIAINCQSLKLGKTVCMGPDIVFSYECLKLSIKKKIVCTRNTVVWTPRKCLWVAWGCVWPKDIFCLDCGTVFFKRIFFSFPFWSNIWKWEDFRISNFSENTGTIWQPGATAARPGVWPVPPPSLWHSQTDNSFPWSAINWDRSHAQLSSEPWHSTNLRARASRIYMFHRSAQTTRVLFSDQ